MKSPENTLTLLQNPQMNTTCCALLYTFFHFLEQKGTLISTLKSAKNIAQAALGLRCLITDSMKMLSKEMSEEFKQKRERKEKTTSGV